MKIVLLTNILSPYRQFFYSKLYYSFRENGVDFTVFVMAETEADREWHYEEFKGEYSELLHTRTIRAGHTNFHFNRNLKKRLQEVKPDILIASGSYISPSVLKAIQLKKKLNYKLLFWSESHLDELRNYNYLQLKIREGIRSYVYHEFDGFWYTGSKSLQFIKKYVKPNLGSNDKDYYFIPNLVDPDLYSKAYGLEMETKLNLKQELDIPNDRFVFILPARLTWVKGIIPFLTLFQKCSNKHRATILILGEGEQKEEIQCFIDQYQLDVRLLGYVQQEDMLCYYSIADCFLLPSLSDPNPLSCIEALWAGLPLLVSENVGNYPEVVKPAQNGYVFNYSDPAKAIQLIDTVISATTEWKVNAVKLSKEIAEDVYDPEKSVNHLVHRMLGS